VSVEWGAARLPEFWDLLTSNLAARHRVAPVHSLSEIELLVARFPGAIEIVLGIHEGCVAAGTVLFNSPSVSHTQYMAASTRGREVAALDLVLHAVIHRASEDGRRFVDFGISTERAGLELNEGLHTFKAEFGGGGVVHEFFRLVLD
jgi:lipid II:glycine glycyltransferase (peptidoglycan interpeptide bridge formation enzyme)